MPREKKLSLQEQMLQDALAASSITTSAPSTSSSSSLLDCNLVGRKDVFHKVSNIVRKKEPHADDTTDKDTVVSQPQNRVVELD